MTSLRITANPEKKRLSFEGDKVSFGEKVLVNINGMEVLSTTRLRVLVGGKTVAMFPLEETDEWSGNTCVLNLNTVQAEKAHCGSGVFVIDDTEVPRLYGYGEVNFMPWPKNEGEDVPYDLGNYPNVIEEFRREISTRFTKQDERIEDGISLIEKESEEFKSDVDADIADFKAAVNTAIREKVSETDFDEAIKTLIAEDESLSQRINEQSSSIERIEAEVGSVSEAIETEVTARSEVVEAERSRALVAEARNADAIKAEVTRATAKESELDSAINREVQNREALESRVALKADLVDGKVPSTQLPSYVDDVLEYGSKSAFPVEGESGKIYVALDTNKTYRWGGSWYAEISESLALGETAETAFPGNRGVALEARVESNATAIAEEATRAKEAEGEISAVAEGAISAKKVQSFTDEEKSLASVNGGYRYLLNTPIAESIVENEVTYDRYLIRDYAINSITISTSTPVKLILPSPVDNGRSRDFVIRLKVLTSVIPTVEFVKSDADASLGFETNDSMFSEIEAGINYYTFTEMERT